ncbi:septal ring lytic transglycosylase RlpA family protein [Pseudanabaena sp. PCC 6802]|uniref:septal ring lytic transglycosylase RlpA family protein n=1 Tax=Pseudanabaena sp. PCC 6802 TaxID=118173 RepID=UPI000347E94E|nr:septal ring lytic transglycosylase RlpA family protein [Pseudanabaena sp. PCC 6802]
MGTIAMIWVASIGSLLPINLNTITSISSISSLKSAPVIANNISKIALAINEVNPQKIFNKHAVRVTPTTFNDWNIWVNNKLIIKLKNPVEAGIIAAQIDKLLKLPNFDPDRIQPLQEDGKDVVQIAKIGKKGLLKFPSKLDISGAQLIKFVNNLRVATGAEPLQLFEVHGRVYELAYTSQRIKGLASWYGPYFHGRMTANGEIFDQHELTAAHKSLPFNTRLKVTNLDNGRSVIVRINDRGPYYGDRMLDLSMAAAEEIGSHSSGVVRIEAVVLAQN